MAAVSESEIALLPSDGDVEFFREHGWYISNKLFSDEEIDRAVEGSERYYAGERDFPAPSGHEPAGWKPEHGYDVLRKNDYASLQNRELTALIRKPILGAAAARLAGAPIRLWHDQLLYKPPSSPDQPISVGWHTDRQYWMTCSSDNMLTAWIPFHLADEEIGTITMIDRSHLWPQPRGLDFFSADLEGLEERFDSGGKPIEKIAMILPKGHVSIHHCRTIHGSAPNLSTRPRRAIAVHMQDEPNRYREYHFRDGSLARHNNNIFCRQVDGKPDYTDPVICPQL